MLSCPVGDRLNTATRVPAGTLSTNSSMRFCTMDWVAMGVSSESIIRMLRGRTPSGALALLNVFGGRDGLAGARDSTGAWSGRCSRKLRGAIGLPSSRTVKLSRVRPWTKFPFASVTLMSTTTSRAFTLRVGAADGNEAGELWAESFGRQSRPALRIRTDERSTYLQERIDGSPRGKE